MTVAVIMAGGRGERLWPLSTPEKPKQFLKLGSERTMLQETVARISLLIPKENIYVVTPQEFTSLVGEQLSIPEANVIAEPVGRNTAPCVGLAAIMLEAKDPRGVMVVLPADHVIKKQEDFLKILRQTVELAKAEDHLITLGIVPDQPATGYGYIRGGKPFAERDGIPVYRVQRFTEKPNRETAERFLKEGGYYWNSGMFVWRIDVILAEIQQHMPKLYAGLQEIKRHLPACALPVCRPSGTGRHADKGMPDAAEVIQAVYEKQDPISIDYGVLERSSSVLVIPADIGWSDVGDWSALDAIFEKDEHGNIICAEYLGIDTKNSIIYGEDRGRLIATIGLENIVIIETEEALLIMDKARAQEVREIIPKV